ncbi:MAG TPA: DUF2269 family protein [Candidatus Limnocylindria bacterium]|nr:DUF2269 family protein [Candidatus Limnocylindria bacterium]
MYQLLVYLHILSGVVWVGGAIYAQVLAFRVSRSEDPTELPMVARHLAALGIRVFMPASVLIIVTGSIMTIQQWSFGQLWIALAVALWVLSAALGGIYVGPRITRVAALFEAEGPKSPAARSLLERLFLVSRLELVSFLVIIGLMVFKPGA